MWRAAPTAVSVHFAVVSSDSTEPITVDVNDSLSLGVVWDGTRSTGTKTLPSWLDLTGGFWLFARGPVNAHMRWWMRAVDAAGKEVGFVDCVPFYGFGNA
jgi:hypothetical protein